MPRAPESSLERPQGGVMSRTWILLMGPPAPCLPYTRILLTHFSTSVMVGWYGPSPWLSAAA